MLGFDASISGAIPISEVGDLAGSVSCREGNRRVSISQEACRVVSFASKCPEERFQETVEQVQEGDEEGDDDEEEDEALPLDAATAVWHEVTAKPFLDPVTGKRAILLMQSDVTERVRAENILAGLSEGQVRRGLGGHWAARVPTGSRVGLNSYPLLPTSNPYP
jgi:hypothetical protein